MGLDALYGDLPVVSPEKFSYCTVLYCIPKSQHKSVYVVWHWWYNTEGYQINNVNWLVKRRAGCWFWPFPHQHLIALNLHVGQAFSVPFDYVSGATWSEKSIRGPYEHRCVIHLHSCRTCAVLPNMNQETVSSWRNGNISISIICAQEKSFSLCGTSKTVIQVWHTQIFGHITQTAFAFPSVMINWMSLDSLRRAPVDFQFTPEKKRVNKKFCHKKGLVASPLFSATVNLLISRGQKCCILPIYLLPHVTELAAFMIPLMFFWSDGSYFMCTDLYPEVCDSVLYPKPRALDRWFS